MFTSMMIHPVNLIKALSSALELSVTGISEHHHRTVVIAESIDTYRPDTAASMAGTSFVFMVDHPCIQWYIRWCEKDLNHPG